MKEQAEREQRSLNDVVSERYGVRTGTGSHIHTHDLAGTYGYMKKPQQR